MDADLYSGVVLEILARLAGVGRADRLPALGREGGARHRGPGGTHSQGGSGGLRHLRGDLVTTQASADDLWHCDDVTVELAAGDVPGSGVATGSTAASGRTGP